MSSVSLSAVRECIVTERLKLESHGFCRWVHQGILASHARFED